MSPKDLDSLVLVGGATRMPAVQQMVATLFGRLPYRHLDPDTIVALGAATQAACKARDEAIEELILTDVCPYTLGISAARSEEVSGVFAPIIERNTVIPTSRVKRFSSTHAEQKMIRIEVYQGSGPGFVTISLSTPSISSSRPMAASRVWMCASAMTSTACWKLT